MSSDFLVEIGTEELPPKALKTLSEAFANSITKLLREIGIDFGQVHNYASPRRLAVLIENLAAKAQDRQVEVWGPPAKISFNEAGNPTKPALAFVEKNRQLGITLDNLKDFVANDGKADKLFISATQHGIATISILEKTINDALNNLPVPKRMRWGSNRREFVRPVHWAVLLYADCDPSQFSLMGIIPSNKSRGHRFHAPGEVLIETPANYLNNLRAAKVIADFNERRQLIQQQVTEMGRQAGGKAIISDDLLDEVTALNEWPVALLGHFDKEFLEVPPEALISSMKEHQKYFHVVDKSGSLLPVFITVSNIESLDPQKVIAGNEKVIRPRLSDAAFFYETDKKVTQQQRRERLKSIIFQNKLGSLFDKTERLAKLAVHIAPYTKADQATARRAGELSKADLVSEMVLEFDHLQGLMGKYYAEHDDEPAEVAAAMFEHYLPRYAGDNLPQTSTGTALALADRLDTLTGIFGIGQSPTGSSDPFALRRASLGILRLIIENQLNIDLSACLDQAIENYQPVQLQANTRQQVLAYVLERFGAFYTDVAAESIQAVAARKLSSPYDIHLRIQAVDAFAKLPEAQALAAANKRVSNILEKNTPDKEPLVNVELLTESAEIALYQAISASEAAIAPLLAKADYQAALASLSRLQAPVDNFFDAVMVMTDDEQQRNNRLALLGKLRGLFLNIADISLLSTK